jgi:hypothetical protein
MPALWFQAKGVVESGHTVYLAQRDVQALADQDQHVAGQVAVVALGFFQHR